MSKIEWTELTWNPVVGCRRVSPGCDNCYAILEARRKSTKVPHYFGLTEAKNGRLDWTGKFNVAPDHIFNKPLHVRTPTTWFVNSMSDLFGEGVADETIERVFQIMLATPHHRYQILTKRPNRAVKLALKLPWPSNVWFGVSIESDGYSRRADLLRKVPAAVRFISAEPLLGPLPSLNLEQIDWLIVGGESGVSSTKVRPMNIAWARDLRDRAVAAKTHFFFKQWGNWGATGQWHRSKKDAGGLLDEQVWHQMPQTGKSAEAEARSPWSGIDEFRDALAAEHALEARPPALNGHSLRVMLRRPIWDTLREQGPLDALTLRQSVLAQFNLECDSARLVNLHAWALVDLQQAGWVDSQIEVRRNPKTGRFRKQKVYRFVKPRIRLKAVSARTM